MGTVGFPQITQTMLKLLSERGSLKVGEINYMDEVSIKRVLVGLFNANLVGLEKAQ